MLCAIEIQLYILCFYKQKTAYEMRISDWSSDVCSSDLARLHAGVEFGPRQVCRGEAEALHQDAVRLAARPNPQLHVPLHVRIARAGDGLGEAGTTHAGAVHAEKLGVLLVQGFGDHLVDVSEIGRAHV